MSENMKPIFKDKQIISVLVEFDVVEKRQLKDTDLQTPTVQLVVPIYTGILVGVLEFEGCRSIDAREFSSLEYPEMHQTTIQYGILAKNIQFILQRIGCMYDFLLSDLIKPDVRRTRFFLSELCNFVVFTSSNVHKVKKAQESRMNHAAKMQALRQTRDELKNEVMKLLEERGIREDKVKDFDKRMAAAESAKKNLGSEIETLETNLGECETEAAELSERNSTRLRAKEDKVAQMKQLEGLVVTSPDRLRGELALLQEASRRLNEQVAAKEATLQERKKLQELMEKYVAGAALIKEHACQVNKLDTDKRAFSKEIESRQAECAKVVSSLKLQMDELCAVNNQSSCVQEKLAAVQLTEQTKLQQMNQSFSSYLTLREKLEEELDVTDQRMSELTSEELELKEEREEYEKYEAAAAMTLQKVTQQEIDDFDNEEVLPTINQKILELKGGD